jgi:FKBP-type peptidyl-prolyl cis-trans isomerase SlyD
MEGKKRMISVTFTGKDLLEGRIFDTNLEKDAKEAGIFQEGKKYSPLTIITGENELLPLVEKELEIMNEGEEKLIKLLAKDAFGERKNDLVRVIPLQNFHEQKINPFPGLVIRIGNAFGKIQSVGSGRVRIDFNHPLAGRDVEYRVRLDKEFKDKKEISEQLYSKYYERIPGTKKEIVEDSLTITLEGDAFKNLDKVNEAIKKVALELGIKLDVKEAKKLEEKGKTIELEKETVGAKTIGAETNKQIPEEHIHDANCNHGEEMQTEGTEEHVHSAECSHGEEQIKPKEKEIKPKGKFIDGDAVSAEKQKQKSIHSVADELKKEKPKKQFDVLKDSSTTIQRPKKK